MRGPCVAAHARDRVATSYLWGTSSWRLHPFSHGNLCCACRTLWISTSKIANCSQSCRLSLVARWPSRSSARAWTTRARRKRSFTRQALHVLGDLSCWQAEKQRHSLCQVRQQCMLGMPDTPLAAYSAGCPVLYWSCRAQGGVLTSCGAAMQARLCSGLSLPPPP